MSASRAPGIGKCIPTLQTFLVLNTVEYVVKSVAVELLAEFPEVLIVLTLFNAAFS